jgi:ethanolamine utilization microcompartment shell protein EutL
MELTNGSASVSDTGTILDVGLRFAVTDKVELGVRATTQKILNVKSDSVGIDARYKISKDTSIGVGYAKDDMGGAYGASLRFDL